MRFLLLCGFGLLTAGFTCGGRAQPSLAPEAPLVAPTVLQSPASSGKVLDDLAGWRALELGMPSVAVSVYRARLASTPAERVEERNRLAIELATALLDDGRAAEVEETLRNFVGPPTATYRLRVALAAIRLKSLEAARTEMAAIRIEGLEPRDRGWYYFAQGQLADDSKAAPFFQQANAVAVSELQKARFSLALRELDLHSGVFTEAGLAETRTRLERAPGSSTGNIAVRQIAVALNGLGRRTEAIDFLKRQIQALPPEQRGVNDELQLSLGLIAGATDPVGRGALSRLLSSSSDRDKQRVALLLLARDAPKAAFRTELDRLIDAPTPHSILEELLLQRAELQLAAKAYSEAEADAQRMLDAFPGSRLKPHALGIRVKAAWEHLRYRRAADYATQAKAALPESAVQVRAELGVLIAEAYFRAPDYRLAADAYAAALNGVPVGIASGSLIFQRIYSEIESARLSPERLAATAALLDEAGNDPRLDETNRWQAEWNLARALQAAGDESTRLAYRRIERLLKDSSGENVSNATLPQDLRVRMAWLRARLSLDVGKPGQTLVLVDSLMESLGGVESGLRTEIASTVRLLQADASFQIPGREQEGLEIFKKLRSDFPQSDAAVESYFREADRAAEQNLFVEAQGLLTKLKDEFPRHPYAPYALFQAALNAERRGQDTFYKQGFKLLEDLLNAYPNSDLVFYARLKQGDLLRRVNEFNLAQQTYELLVNYFSKHPDVLYAHLALAAAHNAQASVDPSVPGQLGSHAEIALGIYERLVDQADASAELRIEAGYNLGLLLSRRTQPDGRSRAEVVWWEQVVTPFLLDENRAKALKGGGREWMSRTLLGLGGLLESQAKLEQAREVYLLLLKKDLPGTTIAKGRLARFGVVVTQ